MPLYAVTLTAEMGITADTRSEAIRHCNDDAREFVVENDTLKVKSVEEVDPATAPTGDLDDIVFMPSEVVKAAKKGWMDWTMNGVYVVTVEAANPAEASESAKTLPRRLAAGPLAAPR